VTAGVSNDTLTCAYNDLSAVERLVEENKNEIAAIIVEPIAGNMGCILPKPRFLEGLRKICDTENIIFIFDEVMTGFRLAKGGAQEKLSIEADLVTYGKIIGAGMPVGAFGGKKHIMEVVAPLGNVYQAGTLAGNPIAMIAGYTLLNELNNNPSIYNELEEKTVYLKNGLQNVFKTSGVDFIINQFGSMISVHFSGHPVTDFVTSSSSNIELFKKYFHSMLNRGVYLPPSAFESWFLNNALTKEDLDATIKATEESLSEIK
jgi:glutamate-1-semialdehyde 2,1-aminomutase